MVNTNLQKYIYTIESNDVYVKYAWRLTVRNNLPNAIRLSGVIEFQDSEGFIVDSKSVYDVVLSANSEDTFTGDKLIDTSIAYKVTNVVIKLK